MSPFASKTVASVIPALRYRNAPAAIEWLCKAFGFDKRLVVPGADHTVLHAELSFGNGLVMVGSVRRDNANGRLIKQPGDIGGETQTVYLVVTDADAHYQRATAAGAEVVLDLKDQDYGGRGYTCRDPEGHIWSFGTYDPWAGLSQVERRA